MSNGPDDLRGAILDPFFCFEPIIQAREQAAGTLAEISERPRSKVRQGHTPPPPKTTFVEGRSLGAVRIVLASAARMGLGVGRHSLSAG